ncbi:MAG TPA: S8 family serine peptidase [Pyrinomonadaceae bacterium]|nr:S8 family serine peptidase [Pyrinomonadaceae bacterium]
MKRLSALLLLIGLCAAALTTAITHGQRPEFSRNAPAAKFRKNAAPVRNNYIVVLDDNSVARNQVSALAKALTRAHGGTLGVTYENALRGFSVEMSEAQAEALSRNPQVAFVEEDTMVEGASTQANPTWALDRIDQRSLPLDTKYNYANAGTGVNAYVIDGGIRMTHQEFGGRAAFAFDNVGDGRNGTDCNGHGTHVAGIIGGNTYGVAKGVKLWSVRVLNCSNQSLASGILAGIDWVTANHVKPAVANLSFASGVGNDALDLSVRNLIAAGVTTVVAAGNNNGDASLRSPARVTEAITVAATDENDVKTSLSNFGSIVDVFAPGANIVSAHSTGDADTFTRTGTSSAAPFVAGTAARYLSGNRQASPAAVAKAITSNATVGKVLNAGEGSPNLLLYRPNTKIAFLTQRDGGNQEIYTMNADGSEQTNVTNNSTAIDQYPSFSPDGTKIVFSSWRDGAHGIFVMNTDGTDVRRVATEPSWINFPVFSPDSTKIAYVYNQDIYVINADGSGRTNLTPSTPRTETEPAWSPDGSKIAFTSDRDGQYSNSNTEVYVMNADGSGQTRMTFNDMSDFHPAWSPDGTKIAFAAYRNWAMNIYVMNADGSNQVNVSNTGGGDNREPFWSADGSQIAYERATNTENGWDIYRMNADGSNQTRLTFNLGDGVNSATAIDRAPVWQAL